GHRRRSRDRAGGGARRRPRAGDGALQPRRLAGLRGIGVSNLWERALYSSPSLRRWASNRSGELRVARLPKPAWPIVAGAVARSAAEAGQSVLILVPAPDRFCD